MRLRVCLNCVSLFFPSIASRMTCPIRFVSSASMNAVSERQQLITLIKQWNENRLELFNLSMPDENDEFHGVMRFYYQEPGEKVFTKSVRVASTATTMLVLEALIEKFRPDLHPPSAFLGKFAIFEVHENGEERPLGLHEFPLIVQLTWHKDDREGRFLLKLNEPSLAGSASSANSSVQDEFGRIPKRFSKREKKELRKRYQKTAEDEMRRQEEDQVSRRLYDEVPTTTFTRTISNPEAVMKKRREQRLENKLKEMGHGGSLKIFGADLNPARPYVTLLVGAGERAHKVVRDTLDKYGLDKMSADDFVLVEITLPKSDNLSRSLSDLRDVGPGASERLLHPDDRPLMALLDGSADVFFAVRRRPPGSKTAHAQPETASLSSTGTGSMYQSIDYATEPALVPLDYQGHELTDRLIYLRSGVTEVGSDPRASQAIVIRDAAVVRPKHCVINFSDGIVSVTPLDGLLEVNGLRTEATQLLRDGFVIRLGGQHSFRFRPGQVRSSYGEYANGSPVGAKNSERPHSLALRRPSLGSVMPAGHPSEQPDTSTTFGVVEGQVLHRRTRSTTDLASTPAHPLTEFNANTLDRMLQNRMGPPTTFPETAIQNLPALIELYDQNVEDEFLRILIDESTPEKFPFRLTPAFMLYMVARFRISAHLYRSGLSTEERRRHLQIFVEKVAEHVFHVVHLNSSNKAMLAFWLTNTSELLFMLRADREVTVLTGAAVLGRLQTTVERAYDLLVETARVSLQSAMTAFLKVTLDDASAAHDAIQRLDELVLLVRKCRLNAALTIQLFSQLFYFINMYAFNWLVTTRDGALYLSRQFGVRLRERLFLVTRWTEQQGMELAAECHLDRLQQTVNLLITPKTMDQIASLGATCYKLNSLQVRYLLENYVPEVGEPRATRDLVEQVAALAQSQADVMALQDEQAVQLEESPQLQLRFVFPEDGYVVESYFGVPASMSDFISALQTKGICRLMPQIGATGHWTVHMHTNSTPATSIGVRSNDALDSSMNSSSNGFPSHANGFTAPSQASTMRASSASPVHIQVHLRRLPGDSIGLSIVAAQGVGDNQFGIYVKKVIDRSAAHRDGRLEKGDQLLAVNGHSLVGISQEEAAQRISSAGSDVHFNVAKRAAYYNGIIDNLDKGSPTTAPSGVPRGMMPTMPQPPPPNFPAEDPPLYRHTRSASASELQADNASLVSWSQAPSVAGGSRLPAHYKPANRPAVVQPQRPTSSAVPSPGVLRRAVSPTALYTQIVPSPQRPASTVPHSMAHSDRQATWLDNYANLPTIPRNDLRPQPQTQTHYKTLSSNGSSPLPAPPAFASSQMRAQEAQLQFMSHFPPPTVKPASGRLSAPLFDHPTRNFAESLPTPARKPMTSEELDSELDAIESKGSDMTPEDIRRYHDLLNRISELRPGPGPLAQSKSTSDFPSAAAANHRLYPERLVRSTAHDIGEQPRVSRPGYTLPFMSEMASKLESKKRQEPVGKGGTTFAATNESLHALRPTTLASSTERLIDDMSQQLERIKATPGTPPAADEPRASTSGTNGVCGTPSLPRPAMRDNSVSPEDRSKKRVQFRDLDEVKENDVRSPEDEPRATIVGMDEVYNDPRQRRLNEIQQKAIKPAVDGAHLGFRDKMRLFAQSVGESTPKERQKVSSAQREIELSSSEVA